MKLSQCLKTVLTLCVVLIPEVFAMDVVQLERYTVTPTRTKTQLQEIAYSVTILDAEEIESSGVASVSDLLRHVTALDIVRSGGLGKLTSVFTRGTNTEHTLVLIDGIKMNDPVSPGNVFDFSHLTTENIEKIEIVRGPHSTLYGSAAIGGVINIITKKGVDENPEVSVVMEGGSFNTFKQVANVRLAGENMYFSGSLSHIESDGISVAEEADGNREEDGYTNTTLSLNASIFPKDDLNFEFSTRFTDFNTDMDNGQGAGQDDPNHETEGSEVYANARANFSLWDGQLKNMLGLSLTHTDRDTTNKPDVFFPFDVTDSGFKSERVKIDWQSTYALGESHVLTFGIESEDESGSSTYYSESIFGPFRSDFDEEESQTHSMYLQDQFNLLDHWFLTLGARHDDHSEFGDDTNYQLSSAYVVEDKGLKIKMAYGTGFKTPTLYQLFSQYGFTGLSPEESEGFDVGFLKSLFNETMNTGVTYFHNDIENVIEFDTNTSRYTNINQVSTEGIEWFSEWGVNEDVSVELSYTLTETEDEARGEELYRRPKHKASLKTLIQCSEKLQVGIFVRYIGERSFQDFSTFPAAKIELGDYVVSDFVLNYEMNEKMKLFGRIDNVFDEEYQEVLGYGTPGLSAYAGFKYRFK